MEPFFMYVSIGALVLLILVLTIIGVALTKIHSNAPFPVIQNTCPDYWDISSNPVYCGIPLNQTAKNQGIVELSESDGNRKIKPNSAVNIGMCSGIKRFGCKPQVGTSYLDIQATNPGDQYQYMKLNDNSSGWGTLYPGKTELCAQKQWASTLDIAWDGVTNYNGC